MTDAFQRSAAQELAARPEFYRELGIYDFYRRGTEDSIPDSTMTAADAVDLDLEVEAPPAASLLPAEASRVATPSPATVPVTPPIPAVSTPVPEESTIPRRPLVS